jgi:hypothetical protein
VTHAAVETETDVQHSGRHRRGSTGSIIRFAALALAVAAALVLVVLSLKQSKKAAPAAPPGPATLAKAWPKAAVVDAPGQLADGAAYSPWFYLDAQTSVGTATAPDGSADRLLLRTGTGEPRELHRVPRDHNPQWAGFAASGDDLVWAESTAGADGKGETRLWRVNWRGSDPAVSLTADTGDIVFFNSQYDLVIADGAVHWAAAAHTESPVTEVRSIPLAGGAVSVRQVPGAYALSAWPWLVSVGSGQAGPVDLFNLNSEKQVKVPAGATELVTCSPVWCRVLVISGTGGPARVDLMLADGSDRRRVASGDSSPAVMDVALIDRFEVLSIDSASGSPTSSQQVLLYDAKAQRVVEVATGVGTILARAGLLWWSTGDNEALVWHVLDLRTLK